MSDQPRPKPRKPSMSKSGVFPRPVLEPELYFENPRPTTAPEQRDGGGTTGTIPVVDLSEGADRSADQSDDDLHRRP